MTVARLIPLPVHAALEVALASIVLAGPFALGFDASALVVATAIGVLMMGAGLSAAVQNPGRGGSLSVSAHVDVDLGLALASALAALVYAIGGEVGAAGLFVAVAVAQGLLAVTTRYSARA
jgi:hypothetical protein